MRILGNQKKKHREKNPREFTTFFKELITDIFVIFITEGSLISRELQEEQHARLSEELLE